MVQIIFSNKTAYTLVAVILLLAGIGITYAAVSKNQAWHASQQVEVTINGQAMSLQEAIDQSKLGGGASQCTLLGSTGIAEVINKKITVPDYCKNRNVCYIISRTEWQVGGKIAGVRTRAVFYTQDEDGNWDHDLSNPYYPRPIADDVNGDSTPTVILGNANQEYGDMLLYDDLSGVDTTEGSWVMNDQSYANNFKIYACPAFNAP